MGIVIKLLVCAALSASVSLSVSRLYNRLDLVRRRRSFKKMMDEDLRDFNEACYLYSSGEMDNKDVYRKSLTSSVPSNVASCCWEPPVSRQRFTPYPL